MAEQIKPSLDEFLRLADALKTGKDTGNAIIDGLIVTLQKDMDSLDLERALLYLETGDLLPLLLHWRRRYIEKALEELDAGERLGLHTVSVTPRIMEEPE